MSMSGEQRSVVTAVVIALLASTVLAAPGAALTADATVDDTAPGAVGDYTVTLRPEPGDAVARNGLKQVTLDFGADRDYSGDLGNLTANDVEVRVGDENGTVWAGETTVNRSGSEVTITLEETSQNVKPGDRIVVRVFGVTNTEIALRNARSLRGFALRASATGPQGNTDGPVEARYTIDPDATPQQTPTEGANGSGAGAAGADANMTSNDTGMAETADMAENASTTASTSEASENTTAEAGMASESTGMDEPTEATSTDTATATPTSAESTQPATTEGNDGGSGGQATETTGPGFGLLVGLVALLAAGLLAARRHE
jgi:PGF-CTERM protein